MGRLLRHTNYSDAAARPRKSWCAHFWRRSDPNRVGFGANDGRYSRLALAYGGSAVRLTSIPSPWSAVITRSRPRASDAAAAPGPDQPQPADGFANRERVGIRDRQKPDCVMIAGGHPPPGHIQQPAAADARGVAEVLTDNLISNSCPSRIRRFKRCWPRGTTSSPTIPGKASSAPLNSSSPSPAGERGGQRAHALPDASEGSLAFMQKQGKVLAPFLCAILPLIPLAYLYTRNAEYLSAVQVGVVGAAMAAVSLVGYLAASPDLSVEAFRASGLRDGVGNVLPRSGARSIGS